MMRVIGGSSRGRRLRAPGGTSTRPTSDRVREAVFDMLLSMGAIDGYNVLDLFAGSGALGIEALSRGASHATFVDCQRAAISSIRANLAELGLSERATVAHCDAMRWISHLDREAGWDLAFVDPPYGFLKWQRLLGELPAARVVAESDRAIPIDEGDSRWEVAKHKRYGGTLVTVLIRTASQKGQP